MAIANKQAGLSRSSTHSNSPSFQEAVPKKRLWLVRVLVFFLPIIVILAAIGGLIGMSALKPQPEEKKDEVSAAPVLTTAALAETLTLKVTAQGEVTPRTEINIVPQVAGKLSYISPDFLEGASFRKGEVLFRVEPSEYELRVVQAKASVAQAQTRVTSELAEAEIARRDWEELGTGSAGALTLREPQVAEARAQLASAQAQLGEAELQLSRTAVTAPFTGRVRTRTVGVGEYVSPGMSLGRAYSVDVMDVRIPLTNSELGQLGLDVGFKSTAQTPGPIVTLSANVANTQREWRGQLTRTDSGFDPHTRVLYGYVEVKDPYGSGSDNGTPLASGLFVTAQMDGRGIKSAVTIPRTALRGNDRVFLAQPDNTLAIRNVTVASSNRQQAIITAGLSPGDIVITSPIRGAAEGMKINPVDSLDISNAATQTGGSDE